MRQQSAVPGMLRRLEALEEEERSSRRRRGRRMLVSER